MQFNYNKISTRKISVKKKIVNVLLYTLALLCVIFVFRKFNFPAPQKEIKKNITNEIIKLK